MGASKYIRQAFQQEWKGESDDNYDYRKIMQARTIEYRKEKRAIIKIDVPTNIPAAKKVGYRAKQGIFVSFLILCVLCGENLERPDLAGFSRCSP